jgi:hypothetical protein
MPPCSTSEIFLNLPPELLKKGKSRFLVVTPAHDPFGTTLRSLPLEIASWNGCERKGERKAPVAYAPGSPFFERLINHPGGPMR